MSIYYKLLSFLVMISSLRSDDNSYHVLLTLLGLVVPILAVKVPVVVGYVLVVVVLTARLTGVEPITNLGVLVAVEPLLPESEAVPGGEEFATLDAAEALKMSFPF